MKRELLKHELIDKVNELEQQNKELLEIKKQYDRVCERNTTLEDQNDELRSMTQRLLDDLYHTRKQLEKASCYPIPQFRKATHFIHNKFNKRVLFKNKKTELIGLREEYVKRCKIKADTRDMCGDMTMVPSHNIEEIALDDSENMEYIDEESVDSENVITSLNIESSQPILHDLVIQ